LCLSCPGAEDVRGFVGGHGMTQQNQTAPLASFLILVLLLSSIFYTLIIRAGHIAAGGGHYVEALMWCPAVAAFLTIAVQRLDIQSLGLSRFGGKYALLGYLLPLVYALIAYTGVWSLGFGFFPDPAIIAKIAGRLGWQSGALFVPLYFIIAATTGMIGGTARALGEEIGWRGFMTPRMVDQFGFTKGAIIAGAIWAAWHMPLLLFADYNSATEWWFALSCFTVLVVASSVILTWLRLRSNSVWPCALFHASHNVFIQDFFTPLTGARGTITPYIIDEFGIALPLVVLVIAIIVWRAKDQIRDQLRTVSP
jgi:membrane protease YdiL (CAAX protease family)